ncbi:hypothetical protein G6F22_007050 [Rhizopus arrhizus]|nr:hypothetical protein G6F22_007050 [Rhizopus arrhizus]
MGRRSPADHRGQPSQAEAAILCYHARASTRSDPAASATPAGACGAHSVAPSAKRASALAHSGQRTTQDQHAVAEALGATPGESAQRWQEAQPGHRATHLPLHLGRALAKAVPDHCSQHAKRQAGVAHTATGEQQPVTRLRLGQRHHLQRVFFQIEEAQAALRVHRDIAGCARSSSPAASPIRRSASAGPARRSSRARLGPPSSSSSVASPWPSTRGTGTPRAASSRNRRCSSSHASPARSRGGGRRQRKPSRRTTTSSTASANLRRSPVCCFNQVRRPSTSKASAISGSLRGLDGRLGECQRSGGRTHRMQVAHGMQSREGAAHGSVLHAPAELQQVQPRVGLLDARIGVMRIAQRQAVVFRHAQADAEVVAKLERGTDATTAHTGGIEQRRANARFNEQAGIRPPAQHRNGTGLPGVLALRVAGLPAREAQLHRQLQRTPRGRLAPPQRATVPDQPCTLVVATAMTELQADGWTGFGGRRQSRQQHQQAGPGAHAARQQRGSESSRDRRDHATTPGGSRTPPSRRQGPARHATVHHPEKYGGHFDAQPGSRRYRAPRRAVSAL